MTSYEGFPLVWRKPEGIAVTSERRLSVCSSLTAEDELNTFANRVNKPPVYVESPIAYHEKRAFWLLESARKKNRARSLLSESSLIGYLIFTKMRWRQENGMVCLITVMLCIRMIRFVIAGAMTRAVLHGRTRSLFRPIGCGFCFSFQKTKRMYLRVLPLWMAGIKIAS